MTQIEERGNHSAKSINIANTNDSCIINSQEIFKKSKLVIIQHHDTFYRLMITRQGKLILTK